MEQADEFSALTKPNVLCEVCKANSFKYKCSKCLIKYCSIPCLNNHKEEVNCTNRLYDPLEYVSNKEIKHLDDKKKENNLVVKRDYEYLMGMDRLISVSKTDFTLKNKYLSSYNNNSYNNRSINKFLTENGMELKFIMQRGCRCFLLPEGSSIHKRNKSRYDNKLKKFQWTMNWNVKNDSNNEVLCAPHDFKIDRCFEDFKLIDIISKKWSKEEFKKTFQLAAEDDLNLTLQYKQNLVLDYISKNKLQMFLKHYPNKMNNLLETNKAVTVNNLETITVSELLTGKTCLEFPTIFVKVENNKGDSVEEIIGTEGKEEEFFKQKLLVYKSVEDLEPPVVELPEIKEQEVVATEEKKENNNSEIANVQPQGSIKPDEKALKLNVQTKFAVKRPLQKTQGQQETVTVKKVKLSNTVQNINNHLPKSIPDLYEKSDVESEVDSDDVAETEPIKNPSSNSLAAKLFG